MDLLLGGSAASSGWDGHAPQTQKKMCMYTVIAKHTMIELPRHPCCATMVPAAT